MTQTIGPDSTVFLPSITPIDTAELRNIEALHRLWRLRQSAALANYQPEQDETPLSTEDYKLAGAVETIADEHRLTGPEYDYVNDIVAPSRGVTAKELGLGAAVGLPAAFLLNQWTGRRVLPSLRRLGHSASGGWLKLAPDTRGVADRIKHPLATTAGEALRHIAIPVVGGAAAGGATYYGLEEARKRDEASRAVRTIRPTLVDKLASVNIDEMSPEERRKVLSEIPLGSKAKQLAVTVPTYVAALGVPVAAFIGSTYIPSGRIMAGKDIPATQLHGPPLSKLDIPLPDGALRRMEDTLGAHPKYEFHRDPGHRLSASESYYDPTSNVVAGSPHAAHVLAHELGHANSAGRLHHIFAYPGRLLTELMARSTWGPAASIFTAESDHPDAVPAALAAVQLPVLYEEGRASVQGMRALAAASRGLPLAKRLAVLGSGAAGLSAAGLSYLSDALTPWIMSKVYRAGHDRVIRQYLENQPVKASEAVKDFGSLVSPSKVASPFSAVGEVAGALVKGTKSLYGAGKTLARGGLYLTAHPVHTVAGAGLLGAGALGAATYGGYKAVNSLVNR